MVAKVYDECARCREIVFNRDNNAKYCLRCALVIKYDRNILCSILRPYVKKSRVTSIKKKQGESE